jgi:hypothetical protein
LKKQAQQPASATVSGLRPFDVYSLSSNTKKHEGSKKLDLTHSDSIFSASGHRPVNPGCLPKVVIGTRQPSSAPCELCPLPTIGPHDHIKAASSNSRTDLKRSNLNEEAIQISGTSRSRLLSPSARSPSALVSVSDSLGLSCDILAPGPSSNASNKAVILAQHQATPLVHKKQHVSGSLINQGSMPVCNQQGTLLYPHLAQEAPIQVSMAPPVPALMSTHKTMATPAHHIDEKPKGPLATVPQDTHRCFKVLPGMRLIHLFTITLPRTACYARLTAFVPELQSRPGLPLQTYHRIVFFTFSCLCYSHRSNT